MWKNTLMSQNQSSTPLLVSGGQHGDPNAIAAQHLARFSCDKKHYHSKMHGGKHFVDIHRNGGVRISLLYNRTLKRVN